MTIGLPLIGAVHLNTQSCHNIGDIDEQSCHQIKLSDSIILDFFTTDDIQLETGGSIWHAGKNCTELQIERSLCAQINRDNTHGLQFAKILHKLLASCFN